MGRKKLLNPKKKTQIEKSYMRKWLDEINSKKFVFDAIEEIHSDSESEIENETLEADLKELQKPLKHLLKKHPDCMIKKSINIECEWNKCNYEINDGACYVSHVHQHFNPSECIDESQEIRCKWDLCLFSTDDEDEFRRHLDFHSYHSRIKSFGYGLRMILPIPLCQYSSKSRNKIPENIGRYFCYWDECTQQYDKFHEFLEHVCHHISSITPNVIEDDDTIRIISNKKIHEIRVDCKWENCKKEICNVHELKRHVRVSHIQEKKVACPNCGCMFNNKTSFVDHFIRQIVSERNFQCMDCFKYYPTEKLLKEHSKCHVNKYQCAFCGLSCLKKSVLARHIRYRHMDIKLFECTHPGCDYKGKSKGDLTSHLNKHKTSILYKCEVFQCQYSAKTAIAYKRHYARVHLQEPQTYQCHCCEKRYMRGHILSKHLIKDHNFRLAPGHSRFFYKQDLDGYFRLQTKRLENLTEMTEPIKPIKDNCTYEVANISLDKSNMSLTMKKVAIKRDSKVETKVVENPPKKKDINDFAVVRNYKNK